MKYKEKGNKIIEKLIEYINEGKNINEKNKRKAEIKAILGGEYLREFQIKCK